MRKIAQEMFEFSYLPALCFACATFGMIGSFSTEYLGHWLVIVYTVMALGCVVLVKRSRR
ncbi:MAG: hypothetical protein HWD83_04015 [Gammaproteobacteria bacterium]|nr:hypothetical protein [Gammaproteobacteria bacterium]